MCLSLWLVMELSWSQLMALYIRALPPKGGTLVNSVGAGDSMVAGFITGFEKTGDLQEALYWGISSGSASAYSENLATLTEVEALLSQVQVN